MDLSLILEEPIQFWVRDGVIMPAYRPVSFGPKVAVVSTSHPSPEGMPGANKPPGAQIKGYVTGKEFS